MNDSQDPHANLRVLTAGEPLQSARGVMILLHGRGGSADSMLGLASELYQEGFAILAPQASGFTWYPHRFIRPVEENEPYLSSALNAVAGLIDKVKAAGIPASKVILGGFSQGACLALEFAARFPDTYGGLLGFSGGLIGDESQPLPVPHNGEPLTSVPVFLGSAQLDPHIPAGRVKESAAIFEQMGAVVTTVLYPGDGHAINEDEITHARQIVARVL